MRHLVAIILMVLLITDRPNFVYLLVDSDFYPPYILRSVLPTGWCRWQTQINNLTNGQTDVSVRWSLTHTPFALMWFKPRFSAVGPIFLSAEGCDCLAESRRRVPFWSLQFFAGAVDDTTINIVLCLSSTLWVKKQDTLLMSITSRKIDRFSRFFHW